MSILRFRALGSIGSKLHIRGEHVPKIRPEAAFSSFLQRRDDCKSSTASNTCEKPVGASATTLPIVLGIVIPVIVAIFVLIYLHRRNIRREALEDAHDPNKGLDFGLEDASGKSRVRRSLMFGNAEKANHKGAQLSMDMNLSSPYLLPPAAHGSRESIHSLARTLHNEQDPYRSITSYNASDAGSVRSINRREDSPYGSRAGSKTRPGKAGKNLEPLKMPAHSGSMPRSPGSATTPRGPFTPRTPRTPLTPRSPEEKEDPFASPATPKPAHQLPEGAELHESNLPHQPIVPEMDTASPDGKFNADEFEMPDIPPPPPVASRNRPDGGRSHGPDQANSSQSPRHHQNAHNDDQDGLGLDLDIPTILSPGPLPHELEHGPLYDEHGNQPQMKPARQPEGPGADGRGRSSRRPPPPDGPLKPRGLKVPHPGGKRMSVGFRPLPPNEMMESDDPEIRANRIRSFYKEYFDESNEAPPPLPTQNPQKQSTRPPQPPKQMTSLADYLEDDDDTGFGDAAYYDAETNAFIMPYAQPVTRRAMTPPPVGRTRDGPAPGGPFRGGPQGPRGSLSGMSLPGGSRPRAGSALGPRPGSSASARWNRGPPQKKLPPPSPLNTLPTPGKLADDSFALTGAIDFAPPSSIREHVAGRSQSPFGERRAYNPMVPAASPLVTAFDELPALPSPHMLRKSTAFTALDFAPPKKFKDSDNKSETGSIRSNRSGISAVQLNAIRSGAGRVSRLPGDTVFTQLEMDNQLKPKWDMRQ